jgi:hypothetical protein
MRLVISIQSVEFLPIKDAWDLRNPLPADLLALSRGRLLAGVGIGTTFSASVARAQ